MLMNAELLKMGAARPRCVQAVWLLLLATGAAPSAVPAHARSKHETPTTPGT